MSNMPYANPIQGNLTIGNSLIIYDGGYYSLDGGSTVSSDTIGPDTLITAPSVSAVSIRLQNTQPVRAKMISIPNGSLEITGSGTIQTDNQDTPVLSRASGIRSYGSLTVSGGASVEAVGLNDGIYCAGLSNTLTVTGGSSIYGKTTGMNTSILGASKYGVYCGGNIVVTENSRISGEGAMDSYSTYGVFCDAGHAMTTAMSVSAGSSVSGTAAVGVYLGGPAVVDGSLSGTGGGLNISHGIQGDKASIAVGPLADVTASAQSGAYAGIIMVYGYEINGGTLTASGGIYGLRSISSGPVRVTDGTLTATGSPTAGSYGIYVENEGLAAVNSQIRGEGSRCGIYTGGSLTARSSTADGYTYAYGADSQGSYGAIIAAGSITAVDSRIIENYSRTEYFDEAYQIPYETGKNITDYRNYTWSITSGSGAVASSPDGQGIHAVLSGSGILTAFRQGPMDSGIVSLDSESTHTIHIPVELTAAPLPEYTVTYDGNGATGGSIPMDSGNPYYAGSLVTVLGNTGNLVRAGYRFIGWTFTPDGSGTVYQEGDTFLMPENNVVLYALWEAVPPVPYTVVYDGNGAESGTIPAGPEAYEAGDTVIVLGNTGNLSRSGYVFAGWSMDPDGSGPVYQDGDTFLMPATDVTLYAVWEPFNPPVPPPVPPCCCHCCHPCCYPSGCRPSRYCCPAQGNCTPWCGCIPWYGCTSRHGGPAQYGCTLRCGCPAQYGCTLRCGCPAQYGCTLRCGCPAHSGCPAQYGWSPWYGCPSQYGCPPQGYPFPNSPIPTSNHPMP